MKYLIIEGDAELRNLLKKTINNLDPNSRIIDTPYVCNALGYLIDTDEEFDKIIIGDELEPTVEFDKIIISDGLEALIEWLRAELQKLKDCKYFSVDFGKICIEFCKKLGKKQPKVIIWTTGFGYAFNAPQNILYDLIPQEKILREIDKYVKDNGMQLVSKESWDMVGEMLTALE